jgi:hypothetical protein
MSLNKGVGPRPKVLEAYMGEATLSTDPTKNILGNYASSCYSVAPATQ